MRSVRGAALTCLVVSLSGCWPFFSDPLVGDADAGERDGGDVFLDGGTTGTPHAGPALRVEYVTAFPGFP